MDIATEIALTETKSPGRRLTLSVVICCYNDERWNDLCVAIRSVEQQQAMIDEIVVVVDHNDALSQRIAAEFPRIIVIGNVGDKGLSGARNSGIAASKGELIAFLDDDAVAEPGMFQCLRSSLDQDHILGAVAAIEPEWLGHPANWFPDEFLWVVGCTYKGMQPGKVRNLLGAAMCVRRTVFERVGGFNSGLGRNHSSLPLGCEETEFCIRANRAHPGCHFEYDAAARCRHKVPPQRYTWKYLAHRCYAEGWSKAHVAFIAQATGSLKSEQVYVTRTVPLGALRGLGAFFFEGSVAGLGRATASVLGLGAAAVGYAVGRVSLARDPGRASALRKLPAVLACKP